MKWIKKLSNNLAYLIIGLILAITGVAVAANVSIPQSTGKGNYISGLANGNYQTNTVCANGQILAASSTSSSGWACVANTAASGATTTITSNILINGPNFTFATPTPDTNIQLSITGSGSTINYLTGWSGTLAAARLNSNVVQSISTSTSGTVFTGSISAQNLALIFPASPTFTNGTFTGTLGVTGTSTLASTTVTSFKATGIPSFTGVADCNGVQFLQITTGLFGCGTPSGGGGSGNSAWTIGSGLIYNATSTDLVGIGTITPTSPLQIASVPRDFINFTSTSTQLSQLLVSNAGNFQASSTVGMQRYPNSEFNYDDTSGTGGDYHLIVATHGNVDPSLVFDISGGTTATPTPVSSGRIMSFVGTRGYDGSEYGTPWLGSYNSDAGLEVYSTQTFTPTAHGTQMVLRTTPLSTTTPQPNIIINDNQNDGKRGEVAIQGYAGQTNPLFTVNPYDGTTVYKTLTVDSPGTTTLFTIASTTGNSLFQINQNGNIGIGTGIAGIGNGAPNNSLQIFSTSNPEADITNATNWPVEIDNPITSTASSTGIAFAVTTSATQIGAGIGFQRQGANTYGDLFFVTRPSGGNPTEQMRISSSGKVGIGTTTPGNALTVIGDISDSNLTSGNCVQAGVGGLLQSASGACGSGSGGGLGTTTPFSAGYLPEATGTNVTLSNSNIFQSTNGNIGIGTTNPLSLLHIYGINNTGYLQLTNKNATTTVQASSPTFIANGTFGGLEIDLTSSTSTATTVLLQLPGIASPNGPGIAIGANAGQNYDFSVGQNSGGGAYIQPIFIGFEAGQNSLASSTAQVEQRPFGAVVIGDQALQNNNAGGGETVAIGGLSLNSETTGNQNTAVGYDSGLGCTTCTHNTIVGQDSGNAIAAGTYNSLFGVSSGTHLFNDENSMIGEKAGADLENGSWNTFLGSQAGYDTHPLGVSGQIDQNYNVKIGWQAGAMGTSTNETIIGAMAGGTEGNGVLTPTCYLSGVSTGCGAHANNEIIGFQSGMLLNRGNNNIFLGYQTGYSDYSGSNNIIIGYNTDIASTTSNILSIGNLIYGTALTNFANTSTLTSVGQIGIGTSTPAAKLAVLASTTDASIPEFIVASSSNTINLSVSANGSTTLTGLILGNVQSGTQCLHALSTGQIVGTGSDCGSGGGGGGVATITPFTNSHIPFASGTVPSLTDSPLISDGVVVGITATSSTANLLIKATGTLNPFVVKDNNNNEDFRVSTNGYLVADNGNIPADNNGIYGLYFGDGFITTTSTTPISSLYNLYSNPDLVFANNTTTVTNFYNQINSFTNFGGLVTNYYGEKITAPVISGGLITNRYGLIVDANAGNSGFGSSTPTATLVIQGYSGSTTPTFIVSTSTGASLLSVASSGSTTVQGLILNNVQSGTQCLHALSTGQVVGTGSDCSAGGGSGVGTTSPFTAGFIPEATSTNVVLSNSNIFQSTAGQIGITSTTPAAWLGVQATAGSVLPIFSVASTSAATYLQVQSNGNVFASARKVGTSGQSFVDAGEFLQVGTSTILSYPTTGVDSADIILDKPNATSDASLILSSVGLGHWEIGMAGDNNLYWKRITGTSTAYSFTNILYADYASGNVGIGTQAPSQQLVVASTSPTVGMVVSNQAPSGSKRAELILDETQTNHDLFLGTDAGANGGQNFFMNWGSFGTGLFMNSVGGIAIQNGDNTINTSLDVRGVTTGDIFDAASSSGVSVLRVTALSRVGINTTTPIATLTVEGTSGTTVPIFTVASSSNASLFQIDATGHVSTGGGTPTCNSGCTQSSVFGDDTNIRVITSSTALTTLTITFSVPYPKTPICIPTEGSAGTTVVDASSTPTTVVLTYSATLTSKVIDVHCEYSRNFAN